MTKRRTIKLKLLNWLFIFVLFAFGLYAGFANAYDNGTTDFVWQANPPEENVTGYRLYYGSESRFDANNNPKSDFSYDYYIDLSSSIRCNNLSYDNDCEYLAQNEISCNGLETGSPSCTLSYLEGVLHLAMTAYTSSDESSYTHEIRIVPTEKPPEPEPEPEPTPEPAPEPTPDPVPEPTPDPIPEPTPEPDPAPTPDPEPAPAPEPQPGPTPEHVPVPAPGPTPPPEQPPGKPQGSHLPSVIRLLLLRG